MSQNDGTFTVTDAEIDFAGVFAYASTIPGTVMCGLVLIAYALVAIPLRSRSLLDRVSFRLLTYSLIANVGFGIAYAVTPTAPGLGCTVGAFFVNLTLCFASFFTTCIAINLHLVLVHSVNGKKMEKYYISGTTLLSLLLTVPTLALGQFGWSDVSATCWYSNSNPNTRLHWIIGTQSFWMALCATVESFCSIVVLVWLYRSQRLIKRLLIGRFPKSIPSGAASQDETNPPRRQQIAINTAQVNPREHIVSTPASLTEDPRFKKVVLRIIMYPVISALTNYSTVALDLHGAMTGLETHLDFRLLVLNLTLYGLRPLAYAILAAADPSFLSSLKVALRRDTTKDTDLELGTAATKLDFSPIEPSHGFFSGVSWQGNSVATTSSSSERTRLGREDGRMGGSDNEWERHI